MSGPKKPKEEKKGCLSATSDCVGLELGYVLNSTKLLYYYNIPHKRAELHYFNYKKPQGCDDIIVGDNYYVIGGYSAFNNVVAISLREKKAVIKASLNVGRFFSTSTGIGLFHIFTVGGRDLDGNSLRSCERYSVKDDRWTQLQPLNVPRECATIGVFDKRYVYAFEGRSSWEYVKTIERYDLLDPEGVWQLIDPVGGEVASRDPRGGAFCAQVSNGRILLAGGSQSFDDNGFQDVYHFDVAEKKFTEKSETLKRGAEFYAVVPLYKGHLYQLAYSYHSPKYDLLAYSVVKGKFTMIDFKEIWGKVHVPKKDKNKQKPN